MKRSNVLVPPAAFALVLAAIAPACDQAAPTPPAPTASKPVAKREPTQAGALERSRQYWSHASKGDWIAAYDFLAPELQAQQPLAAYLQGKQYHVYEGMRVIEVVAQKDDQVFVRVGGRWTPTHPETKRVKLEPGQTLTQDVELIELWRWMSDEWRLVRPLRPDEFLEEYPDFQTKTPDAAATTPAKPGAAAMPK